MMRYKMLSALCLMVLTSFAATAKNHSMRTNGWRVGEEVDAETVSDVGIDRWFTKQPIPDDVFARMIGKSYPEDCSVSRSSLCYLRLLHYDFDGKTRKGEMVCNKAIAADLISIFKELYRQRYPIQDVQLVDDFDADDELSMRANNSTCFFYRRIKGSKKLSAHSRGMAVDINALYNPYYRRKSDGRVIIQPSNAKKYCNRDADFPYKIERNDLLHRLFLQHGFRWGGAWRSMKDYQHFEK